MGTNMCDLWPDDLVVATEDLQSPLAILKEQASLLGAKTKNIVKAKVVKARDLRSEEELLTNEVALGYGSYRGPTTPFRYLFLIHSPALGDYRYRLFEISYDVGFYPVSFQLDEDIVREWQMDPKQGIVADDESAFVDILSRVLKSKRTRQVIQAILSQALESSDTGSRRSE